MNYPTMKEVEEADRVQLCRWYRFLPSPKYDNVDKEEEILNKIVARWKEVGGFTPEISKKIGWVK